MTNISETNDADLDEMNGNKIILSTIHQAKGLEWSVVLMIWCSDGMIPLARALKDPDGEEEERRLFYVATTRAKDQLYLCYPLLNYTRGAGYITHCPSRFIRELAHSPGDRNACPYDQWIIDESVTYY
ncbi:MAG: ATP-binding domain-containing protein [Deltaproteobacteria bacterium]|nr:ATP-binding domain-containing protein [Deltaproteobacteria bacterium]